MKYLVQVFVLVVFISCQEEIQERGVRNPVQEPDEDSTEVPVSGKYAACLSVPAENSLDIVTWNIEQFPKNANTISYVAEIIKTIDADVISLQEINSLSSFNALVASLEGWSGKLYLNGSLGQGFLYKTDEITSLNDLTLLFTGDSYAFPRPLVVTTAKHVSGKEVMLINVHLKCCNDGEERRKDASVKLKAYLDANLTDKAVVVLGDFNDDITSSAATNVFQNFIADNANYSFADMSIAQSSSSYWSYPSWPSHIDHILITNELFSTFHAAKTLRLDICEPAYEPNVSDHRPVMVQFK